MFSSFESIEHTLGAALSVAAETLPLRSAILIEEAPGRSSMVCWRADDESEQAASLAKTHARHAFAYLAGSRPSLAGVEGSSVVPSQDAGEGRRLFIVIPLVVERARVFGALQMESAVALDEADLAFVSAIANQLALALARPELRPTAAKGAAPVVAEVAVDFAPAPLRVGSRQRKPPEAVAMLASLATGVVAVDLDGIVTYLNSAAEDLLGWRTLEARGMPVELIVNEHDAEGGACLSPCEHPLINPNDPVHNDRDVFTHRNGTRFPVSYVASALFEAGRHTGALLLFADISARRRVEDMQRCLATATSVLAKDLHCAVSFRRLAQVVTPLLGDICLCDAVGDDNAVIRLGHAHVDAALEPELDGLLRPATSPFTGPIADVIGRRMSGVFPRIDERWRREMLADAEDRRMFAKLGIGSLLIVPITLGERALGALSFAFVGSRQRHGSAEVSLANQLACRAAFALDNGRRYEQSQRAVQHRDRVLGVVSHDLRNPLSLIMMGTQRLAAGRDQGTERRRDFSLLLPVIQRASLRMRRLVDDLLDYASIDAGRLGVALAHEDAGSILNEAIASFAPLAEARTLGLTAALAADLPPVGCDRERILQVLANLLANALALTPPHGTIAVSVSQRGQEVVFEISDTGPGLTDAQLKRVFERFWRGEDAPYSGTGMGLAIAEGIVHAHGGRIWAESNLGKGATFAFSLLVA